MRELREILKCNEFRFNKAYGQNFITDKNLLSAIVADSGITHEDTVIEIGAGGGTLTRQLAAVARKVYAFEIDKNLMPVLSETLEGLSNVEVIFKDIMKTDLVEIEEITGGNYKIVANLPYYITTPIVMKFIEGGTSVKGLTIMVQKEVADRFCALENTADYGSITVAIGARGRAKLMRIVSKNMFYPVPNVDSAIVRIDIESRYDIADMGLFQKTYKSGFAMRRKTLINNLVSSFDISRKQCETALTNIGVDIRARGETLSVLQYVNLTNQLKKLL